MRVQFNSRYSEPMAIEPEATSIQLQTEDDVPIVGVIQISKDGLYFEDLPNSTPVTLPCTLPKAVLDHKFVRIAVLEPQPLMQETVVSEEQSEERPPAGPQELTVKPETGPMAKPAVERTIRPLAEPLVPPMVLSSEEAKSEPKAELPAKPEPAKPEPAKPEPKKAEPVKPPAKP